MRLILTTIILTMFAQPVRAKHRCNNKLPISNTTKKGVEKAVIVKGETTITKGFDHWKNMVFSQKEKMGGNQSF